MADDWGLMDWSLSGAAQDLNVQPPRPYYRDIAMPGGFPLTPPQPSTPIFERSQPAIEDGSILNASKRICTTAARAATAFTTTASISMTAILRNMQQMRFRTRRVHQPEIRRHVNVATSGSDASTGTLSQSPPGPIFLWPKEARRQRSHTTQLPMIGLSTPDPSATSSHDDVFPSAHSPIALMHKRSISKEAEISRNTIPEPVITPRPAFKLWSPFAIIKPTLGARAELPLDVAASSLARQNATEVNTFSDESDSSSTFDGNWIPNTPLPQVKTSTTPIDSAVPDIDDWYYSSIDWTLQSNFTKPPPRHNAIKSHAELLEEGRGNSLQRDLTKPPPRHNAVKSRAELLEEGQGNSRQTRRSKLKAKIALGDTSKFDIKPLSEAWEAKVDDALKNGHGRLQARDFQKIVPPSGKAGMDAWLNDESINEYLSLITKHANKDIKPKSTPRMHAFSTFFYTSLKTGGYKKVARWAKRANLAGSALLDVEKIFIPINPNQSHWTLAVIQPRIRLITHYNSLGSGSKAYLDVICEWLRGELGSGFNKDDWELDYAAESPQQMNGSDCGVFTVTTAKQIMLGISPMTYGASDIPTQRRRMVAELVNGDLLQI